MFPASSRTTNRLVASVICLALLGAALFTGGTPARAAVTGVTVTAASCASATVSVSYSGLVGANPNFIRVYGYVTALGLPAGDLGQIFSPDFTAASGTLNITLTFTSQQGVGTNITLWVSQFEQGTFASVSDIRPAFDCINPGPAGPFAPSGYSNRVITCTTQLRDGPNGNVVPGVSIFAGQTWPVAASPVADSFGANWYGVFVGSVVYIPATCVQGGLVSQPQQPTIPTPPPGYGYNPRYPYYPPPAPPNPYLYQPPTYPGSGYVYIVQPGDNLFRIALRFGVPLRVLAAYNNIYDVTRIYVGQRIVIP